MDKKELAQEVQKVSKLEGSFKLRSGKTSSFYFDKYRFESRPKILSQIADHLQPLIPKNIDFLAGLELGGVPLAAVLSLKTQIPCVFVRKKAKDYGTCSLAEGADIKGKKLLIIEDVVTTGGQVVLSAEELRKRGAVVESALCVIYRGPHTEGQGIELLNFQKINLKLQSLFTLSDFSL